MRSLRRSVSEDFEVIGAPKRRAKPKKMSLKAAGRRASVMGYETEGLGTIAEGVPKTKKYGPKKMAKPGRRNSVEVIGPCLYAIPHLLCSFFYGAEAVFCTTHLCSDEARWICLQAKWARRSMRWRRQQQKRMDILVYILRTYLIQLF